MMWLAYSGRHGMFGRRPNQRLGPVSEPCPAWISRGTLGSLPDWLRESDHAVMQKHEDSDGEDNEAAAVANVADDAASANISAHSSEVGDPEGPRLEGDIQVIP